METVGAPDTFSSTSRHPGRGGGEPPRGAQPGLQAARLTSAPSGDLAESPKSLQFLSDLVKGSDSTPSWGGAPG